MNKNHFYEEHRDKGRLCLTPSDPKKVRSSGIWFEKILATTIDIFQADMNKTLFLATTAILILHYTEWTFLRE